MPRRSGPEVYEAIQAVKRGVAVLFVTGYSNEMAALTEMVERGIPVLRKPYSPGALSRRVREALDLVAARSLQIFGEASEQLILAWVAAGSAVICRRQFELIS
jgi:FixJ family two-component response regulator